VSKYFFGILLAIGCIINPVQIFSQADDIDCSEEIIISFFPQPFVEKTFDKFDVSDKNREEIYNELAKQDEKVIETVEAKGAKMDPNPLHDPRYRQEAVKLFRQTLLDLFSQVLTRNGITDPEQIQAMLDDIQQQKLERFRHCIERYRDQESPDQE